MKVRIIDTAAVSSMRLEVDQTWTTFANLLVTAFGDVLRQNGFSKKDTSTVYCPQRVRKFDEKLLDSLIYNVPPAFISHRELFGSPRDTEGCTYLDKQRIHWSASKESPFLLLGHIGTGKTTLLDHYFYDYLPEVEQNVRGIIVNFKVAPNSDDGFISYMLEEIDNQMQKLDPTLGNITRELFEKLFADEVAAVRSTIKDPARQDTLIDDLFTEFVLCKIKQDTTKYKTLIEKKIKYLKRKFDLTIWIVLDNIDQHLYCLHHRVFVNAISVAHKLKCPLIISMRYVTFGTPNARETYDSYRPRRLKLSLPDVSQLIENRLKYFDQIAAGVLQTRLKMTGDFHNIEDLRNDIRESARLLKEQKFLNTTLLPIANYNLRRLLDIFLASFQSYYFYFDRFNNERYRPNPASIEKRFLYAHMLKNSNYYDPLPRDEQELFIINLFENENKEAPYNQTIRIRLLQALMSLGKNITMKQYVSYIKTVFNYQEDDILQALRIFLESKLFALKGAVSLSPDDSVLNSGLTADQLGRDDLHIALTYSGRAHYELLYKREYVEIVKFSTYVDEADYIDIQGEENQRFFPKRKKSTHRFLDYLIKQEIIEIEAFVKDQQKFSESFGAIMPSIAKAIRQQLDELEKAIIPS